MYDEWTYRLYNAKFTVETSTSRPPGRKQQWTAEHGPWRATATTEKGAVDEVGSMMRMFILMYRPPSVITYRGHTAVVSLDTDTNVMHVNWQVRIVRPNGTSWTVTTSSRSWDEVEAYARHSLAHATTDWRDDASVRAAAGFLARAGRVYDDYSPKALKEYAAWQRAAHHAIDAGIEDHHSWACEHAHEFQVPPASTEDGAE